MDLFSENRLLNDPGKIGSFHSPIAYGPRDSKACGFRTGAGLVEKSRYDFTKPLMFSAGKDAFRNQLEAPILRLEISQPGIGPTNIAGQNHFSKFLQRRPSRSRSSSASFGPQVPEA